MPESEIDISAEWETQISDEPKAASFAEEAGAPDAAADHARTETIKETIEELRFYLAHSMADQARVVFTKLEKLKPGAAQLAAVWQEIEAAEAQAGPKQPEAVEEVSIEEADEVPFAPEIERAHPARSKPAVDREFVSHAQTRAPAEEFKLPVRPIVPAPEPTVPNTPKPDRKQRPPEYSASSSLTWKLRLGDGFLPPAPVPPAPQAQPRAARSR